MFRPLNNQPFVQYPFVGGSAGRLGYFLRDRLGCLDLTRSSVQQLAIRTAALLLERTCLPASVHLSVVSCRE
jgi:hypothetical protein